jgi:hypothetical protein
MRSLPSAWVMARLRKPISARLRRWTWPTTWAMPLTACTWARWGALAGRGVRRAAGLQPREDGIAVDPNLLQGWVKMAFPVQWREWLVRLRFEANSRRIEVAERGDELAVAVVGGPDGDRALQIALIMLAQLGPLQHGDKLDVAED